MPADWPPLRTYFMITLILSPDRLGAAWRARCAASFLSLRTEEFVTAARLDGMQRDGIIFRHMLPSFTSHIIASITLAIPAMILAETALSFLGLGLQPPTISWGVLLQRGAEHPLHRHRAVAVRARRRRRDRGHRPQLPRRRTARRRRSVQQMSAS